MDDPSEVRERQVSRNIGNPHGISANITVKMVANAAGIETAANAIQERLKLWLAGDFGGNTSEDIRNVWDPIFARGIIYIVEENDGHNLYVVNDRTIRIAPSEVDSLWPQSGLAAIVNNNFGAIGFDTSRETVRMAKEFKNWIGG